MLKQASITAEQFEPAGSFGEIGNDPRRDHACNSCPDAVKRLYAHYVIAISVPSKE